MNYKKTIALLMLSTTMLGTIGTITTHADTRGQTPATQQVDQNQDANTAIDKPEVKTKPKVKKIKATLQGWEWSQTGSVITLNDYVGTSKDVVIPTAKDLGQEGAEVQISRTVLKDVAQEAKSVKTSANGQPIKVSDTSLNKVFENNYTLTTVIFNSLNTTNVTDMSEMFSECESLTSLDLRSFDTSKVTDIGVNGNRLPLLVKTTDAKLKNYDYASDNRAKMGTVKNDAAYGTIDGQASTSLFDYTTNQPFNDALIQHQLEAAQGKLQLNPGLEFNRWEPAGNYQTFLEKAQGTYNVKVPPVKDNAFNIHCGNASLTTKDGKLMSRKDRVVVQIAHPLEWIDRGDLENGEVEITAKMNWTTEGLPRLKLSLEKGQTVRLRVNAQGDLEIK
ncbi:BspA family leucine-rich repeat surface protein [Enterococcus hirae]|nr:BspA family leucine-rich repeat surface protein [Enterococcus hirae]